jgi:hypothetical protein
MAWVPSVPWAKELTQDGITTLQIAKDALAVFSALSVLVLVSLRIDVYEHLDKPLLAGTVLDSAFFVAHLSKCNKMAALKDGLGAVGLGIMSQVYENTTEGHRLLVAFLVVLVLVDSWTLQRLLKKSEEVYYVYGNPSSREKGINTPR